MFHIDFINGTCNVWRWSVIFDFQNVNSFMQDSHRPPFTLKLKFNLSLYPRIFASVVVANKSRISSIHLCYVAGLFRGFFPIDLVDIDNLSRPQIQKCLELPWFFLRRTSRAKAFSHAVDKRALPQSSYPLSRLRNVRVAWSTSDIASCFRSTFKWIQPYLRWRSLGTGMYFAANISSPCQRFRLHFGVPAAITRHQIHPRLDQYQLA